MQTLFWHDFIPLSEWFSSAFLNKADKPSVHRRNKYGDSGCKVVIYNYKFCWL